MPFYASYPVFPGRVFDDNDVGTFVAPASGAKPFFAMPFYTCNDPFATTGSGQR
jgi:hypothetical protein